MRTDSFISAFTATLASGLMLVPANAAGRVRRRARRPRRSAPSDFRWQAEPVGHLAGSQHGGRRPSRSRRQKQHARRPKRRRRQRGPVSAVGGGQESRELPTRQTADPLGQCFIPGVPRIMYLDLPFQVFQTPRAIAMTFEWSNDFRTISRTRTSDPAWQCGAPEFPGRGRNTSPGTSWPRMPPATHTTASACQSWPAPHSS